MNIGSIQKQTGPLVLQLIGPEVLKTAAVLPSRGELNAFLFLLDGILNPGEAALSRPEVTQTGNRTINSPAESGQSKGKDAEGKGRRELGQMVSRAAPEPAPPIAKASPFVMAPQLETKHEAFVVPEGRLAPNFERQFSATAPYRVGSGDTRATPAPPGDARQESQGDVAFALRISPKAPGSQNASMAAAPNETPWHPVAAMENSSSVVGPAALTAHTRHASAAEIPANSTASAILVDQPVPSPSDPLQIQTSLLQGVVLHGWVRQDASKSENPVPVSPARSVSGGNGVDASMNLRSRPSVNLESSLHGNAAAATPKDLNREETAPLDSSQTPEVALSGSSISLPSVLTQPTLVPPSGPAFAHPQDLSAWQLAVSTSASETNAGAVSAPRKASPEATPPIQQETRRPSIQAQLGNASLKPRQDSTETKAEMKGSDALPAKPNSPPTRPESGPHDHKPEIPGIVSPRSVSLGVVPTSIRDTPGERGRANLPSASNPPTETVTKDPLPSQPARQISFKLAGASSNVNVLFTDKAGKVEVAVRTPDQNLTKSLQADLGDLVARLEASGLRTETWAPMIAHHAPGSVAEPSNSANSQGQPGNPGSGSGNQQQRGQNESDQRQQPRWMAQLDESLTVEDKRMEDE